jgi:hypothetical protein
MNIKCTIATRASRNFGGFWSSLLAQSRRLYFWTCSSKQLTNHQHVGEVRQSIARSKRSYYYAACSSCPKCNA